MSATDPVRGRASIHPQLAGRFGRVRVVAAMDVSEMQAIVRRHLLYALGVLALAAGLSVGIGAWSTP